MTTATKTAERVTAPRRTPLGRVLVENAIVSGASGLVLTVGSAGLDSWLGVNAWVLAGVGAGLLLYAAGLVSWARSSKWLRRGGLLAVAGDTAWVIGAVVLVAFTDVLTTAGEIALAVVTAMVLGFVVAQTVGLVKLATVG